MSHKNAKIETIVAPLRGGKLDAHYLGYFECFNRQLYFEAHEVLEVLWLPARKEANGAFYKGLIQLAGAFVHLQKSRMRPAAALLKLSIGNLVKYQGTHEGLEVEKVVAMADDWLRRLEEAETSENPLLTVPPPTLAIG